MPLWFIFSSLLMWRTLSKLRDVDRRWLYAGAAVVLLIPLVVPMSISGATVSPATRGVWNAIESCPPDKVIVVDSSLGPGSAPENRAQLECVVRHLCRRGVKFVVTSIGIDPFAPQFADRTIEPLAAAAGYQYGRDWVNLGYVPGPPPGARGAGLGVIIESLCRDVHRTLPRDAHGAPVGELALMQRVRSHANIHLFCCITYQADDDWLSVIHGVFGGRLAVGCMSIVGPYFYPFLDSGQLVGMLIGNRGAAEYELLLGAPGRGTRLTMAGSFGNLAIIAAALLGNLGWYAARRVRRGAAA